MTPARQRASGEAREIMSEQKFHKQMLQAKENGWKPATCEDVFGELSGEMRLRLQRGDTATSWGAPRPKRLQRLRSKGWRKPPNSVIVDRTSRFGNPYKLVRRCPGEHGVYDTINNGTVRVFADRAAAARHAIELYKPWLEEQVEKQNLDLSDLQGKDLLCWCSLDSPCHADVLLELANPRDQPATAARGRSE